MKATLKSLSFPNLPKLRPQDRLMVVVVVFSYLLTTFIIVLSNQFESLSTRVNLDSFEVGQVAQRDLVSDRNLVYVDRQATRERADQAASEVPPVFDVNVKARDQAVQRYNSFADLLTKQYTKHAAPQEVYAQISQQFPGLFTSSQIRELLRSDNLLSLLPIAATTIHDIMTHGVLGRRAEDFATAPGSIKLVETGGSARNPEVIPAKSAVTTGNLSAKVQAQLSGNGLDVPSIPVVTMLVLPFIVENAQYDYLATQKSRDQARGTVEPVIQRITKGEKVLRKGFVITASDMDKIRALGSTTKTIGAKSTIGTFL